MGECKWGELVDATVEMVDAYMSLGEMEREGLGSGSGEVVAKDWRFKAKSVVRKVMGVGRAEGKEEEEEEEGWERLVQAGEGLKP